MIPILYKPDAKTKIGWLAEASDCQCTEERNGVFELEFQYPMLGRYAADLVIDRYVKAKPNATAANQFFHIRKVSKPINGMFTISCEHISYALSGYPVPTVSASGNAQVAINAVLTAAKNQLGKDTGFSAATTDITLSSSIALANVSARAALGGVSGSVLDVYGGEYEFDNHTIKLHKSRGQDHGVRISYGRNMTDLKCEIDMDSAYTGIYGYVKNDDVDLKSYVSVTNSSGINAKTLIRDFSSDFSGDEITQAKLDSAVSAYVAKNDINSPSVSMTVSFVDLSQSPEYASFSALEAVNLCDTVIRAFRRKGDTVAMIKLTLDTTLQKLNISRYELAKRTGIQYQIIDNYYKNRVKRYDSDVLDRICTALGCGIEDIIEYSK